MDYGMLMMFVQIKEAGYEARQRHSSTAFRLGPGFEEVTLFGGLSEKEMASTTVLQYGEFQWVLLHIKDADG